jgi:GDPmannose 4,6-dehydratase
MSKVVIIGAGQDGSYMAEYLLRETEHEVVVATRRTSHDKFDNLAAVLSHPRLRLATVDLNDAHSITSLIQTEVPAYLINLGGSTFVPDSFNSPAQVMLTNGVALIHILEAVRQFAPACRVFSAGSSTEADCKSIYAVSKIAAGALCKVYREKYGLYVVHGIMYNHCSPRQSEVFLPRKIAKGVARIACAIKEAKPFEPIELGNLDAQIDISWSEDFVDGIWRMMNQDVYRTDRPRCPRGVEYMAGDIWGPNKYPDISNYTLASGELHTVREMVEKAFAVAGWEALTWIKPNDPKDEYLKGVAFIDYQGALCSQTHTLVIVNPAFYRSLDATRPGCIFATRKELDWSPKTPFNEIVKRMVEAELAA